MNGGYTEHHGLMSDILLLAEARENEKSHDYALAPPKEGMAMAP